MTTNAIAAARAKSREVEATIAADIAKRQELQNRIAPLEARKAKALQHLASVQLLALRPGERVIGMTLSGIHASYLDYAKDLEPVASIRSAKAQDAAVADLLVKGTIKVNLPGEGTQVGVRGLAQKVVITDRAALARIAASRKRAEAAQAAAREAVARHNALLIHEHSNGERATAQWLADQLAKAITPAVLGTIIARTGHGLLTTYLVDEMRTNAKAHLDHALAKTKNVCPCRDCVGSANRTRWAAESEARAKEDAKALNALQRVSFTCPSCGADSVSTVKDGTVKCGNKMECTSWKPFRLEAVRTKHVTKATPIGLVIHA